MHTLALSESRTCDCHQVVHRRLRHVAARILLCAFFPDAAFRTVKATRCSPRGRGLSTPYSDNACSEPIVRDKKRTLTNADGAFVGLLKDCPLADFPNLELRHILGAVRASAPDFDLLQPPHAQTPAARRTAGLACGRVATCGPSKPQGRPNDHQVAPRLFATICCRNCLRCRSRLGPRPRPVRNPLTRRWR